MILVTVGMHNQGFDRLVRAADELAAELEETVIIQYGNSCYIPRHARSFDFMTEEKIISMVAEARVVVSHAAAGSIILALRMSRPLVLAPRSKDYHESFDNHQLELAQALGEAGQAVVVIDPDADSLRRAIEQAIAQTRRGEGAERLILAIREQLANWEQGKK